MEYVLRQGNEFSEEQVKSLIGLIFTSDDFREEYKRILGINEAAEEKVSLYTGAFSKLKDWLSFRDPIEARRAYQDFFNHSPLPDHDYLNFLVQLKADRPAFGEVIGEIFVMAHKHIANEISTALKGQLPSRLQQDMNLREKEDLAARCQQFAAAEEARSWKALRDQLIQDLEAMHERYAQIWIFPFFLNRDTCL